MTCDFCTKKDMENRIAYEPISKDWYVLVPKNPEIFGHVVVTIPGPPCIDDLTKLKDENHGEWKALNHGVMAAAKALAKLRNVEKIYAAFLGESTSVHIHCHLIPRYGFLNNYELDRWSGDYRLNNGNLEWRRFYSNPTFGFQHLSEFRYLGEVERTFNEIRSRLGNPTLDTVCEIKEKIQALF